MEQKTPTNATELFNLYRHHLPAAPPDILFRVTRLGMAMMLAEYDRLIAIQKLHEELKSDRKLGRPLGRPPKETSDG